MSEIVPHPRAPEGRERQRQRNQARDAIVSEQREARRLARQREARKAHIDAALAKHRRIPSDEEGRRIARNVWKLKETVEQGPERVSARAVLERIGQSKGSEDSTKRLPRFALEPGLAKEIEDKRAKELPKKVAAYVKFARAAAELGKLDPDEAVEGILIGTRYLDDLPKVSDEEMHGEIQQEIAEAIENIAKRLDTMHRLRDYFKTIQAQHLVQRPGAPEAEPLVSASDADWSTIQLFRPLMPPPPPPLLPPSLTPPLVPPPPLPPKSNLLPAPASVAWAVALCPRLHIGTRRARCVFAGVAIGQVAFHDAQGREVFTTGTQTIEVNCEVTTDVEIALGPFGPRGAVTPFLVMREVTRIKPSADQDWTAPDGTAWSIYSHETIGECSGRLLRAEDDARVSGDDRLLLKPETIHWSDGQAIATFALVCDASRRVAQHVAPSAPKRAESVQFWEPAESLTLLPLWLEEIAHAPAFLRAAEGPLIPFDVWTDERHGGTALKDHPLLDDQEGTRFAQPVTATDGTLLALLERWLRGDVRNRERFELCLEAEVEKAIGRLEATKRLARERFRTAIYGNPDASATQPDEIDDEEFGEEDL